MLLVWGAEFKGLHFRATHGSQLWMHVWITWGTDAQNFSDQPEILNLLGHLFAWPKIQWIPKWGGMLS
jgi:hypothetical protein